MTVDSISFFLVVVACIIASFAFFVRSESWRPLAIRSFFRSTRNTALSNGYRSSYMTSIISYMIWFYALNQGFV